MNNLTLDTRIGRSSSGSVRKSKKSSKIQQTQRTNAASRVDVPSIRPLPGKYQVHDYWARLDAVQHQATAAQLSLRVLQRTRLHLKKLYEILDKSPQGLKPTDQDWAERIQHECIEAVHTTKYQGDILLTPELQPTLLGHRSQRNFRIPGVNLATAANREERLDVILTSGKPRSISLFLPAQQSQRERVMEINRAFGQVGIGVKLDAEGTLLFHTATEDWDKLNGFLYLRGGGVRVPSGHPLKLAMKNEYSWREVPQWVFADAAQIKDTKIKTRKLLGELTVHIKTLQQVQTTWLQQIRKQPNNLSAEQARQLTADAVMDMFPTGVPLFKALKTVTTQANIGRSGATALLAGRRDHEEY